MAGDSCEGNGEDTRVAKGGEEPWKALGVEMATMNQRIGVDRLGGGCGWTRMPGQTMFAAAFQLRDCGGPEERMKRLLLQQRRGFSLGKDKGKGQALPEIRETQDSEVKSYAMPDKEISPGTEHKSIRTPVLILNCR